jgi:FAD/FMN-containing dehydrogenase
VGDDGSRAPHPGGAARPLAVYLPRSTDDVVRAVRESDRLGRPLVVCGAGHFGDDRVPAVGGALLLTAALDRVLDVDVDAQEATVQPGAAVGTVDGVLAAHGLGLEVRPEHHASGVGGRAAGGQSVASLVGGPLRDAVLGAAYVDRHGDVHRVAGGSAGRDLLGELGDGGAGGILTEITLHTVRVASRHTVLRGTRRRYTGYEAFLADAQELFADPGHSRLARGSWTDLPQGHGLVFGALSGYEPLEAAWRAGHGWGRVRAAAAFGGMRALGRWSGRLPGPLATTAGQVAAGLLAQPRYARHGDVERFADGVAGWATARRRHAVSALVPVEALPDVFAGMYAAARTARLRDGGVTFVAFQLAGLRLPEVGGQPAGAYVDVLMVLGVADGAPISATLDRLAHAVDDVCRRHGAHRYLRTATTARTVGKVRRQEPARRRGPAPGTLWEVSA